MAAPAADQDAWSPYACPLTRAPLTRRGEALSNGDRSYAIRRGIPQFLQLPPAHENPENDAALQRLNELAGTKGWLEALHAVYGQGSDLYRYVTTPRRAAFLDLLPLTASSVVLEVGPGLGQFSPIIASRAKWLYALEIDPAQAEFAATRCTQSGAKNVSVACGGDDCRLPYLDNSFDVAIANLVFEWCGARNRAEPLEVSQRRLLAEFARVLKPGGALWLATKNRYALRYVVGKGDEHAFGMRFGNALPRFAMNALVHLRGKGRTNGLLHSHSGLSKMLRAAGLGPVQSFWAAPEMRYPKHFIPTEASSIRAARRDPTLVQGEGRIARLLMPRIPAAMVKHFTPGLAFIARKRP